MYRNGSSSVTGLVGSVVYCVPGVTPKLCAGAPMSPEKTWFQTLLVQSSMLLFLTMNCCWLPLITLPPCSTESAMNPPLE